ncbi:hypothetical protein CANTEDRAFT_116497 [Yamadazyma tenuis ATCC 10573]|uniref:Major facilitator superfamily (MFS) profile domain-containing protein n=2 Tax=Candida tenuis (strain ATCC 10573 / BCRC 21748 / CBS 615 / JCM 9827 / NBRC 10315 / NRRL Y-1498 / VKM Y-70) TaxID=590646 RepID=G3BE33_CANTC|nr:uncharacterized protein CANTEDRAFT_116497 [Yamadazyma tenuis ATCC 10573]EGV60448.1 hypothetical protein CANTEDRAFT_116497 [Yamadazyma tenuis ATCC 10573]
MSLEQEFKEAPLAAEDETKSNNDVNSNSSEQLVQELADEYGINQKKLMWKVDVCVVPGFCLLYFLSFLDRVNISNARLYGLEEDLNMTGDQFNIALALFYVPYVAFELVSNYSLKFIRPHIWLSSCIFLFGCVTIGMGFAKTFGQLVACRVLIGMTEAATFPGLFYILSSFYANFEAQRRFSIFFSCTCLAGGASGAIAYKINDLNGVHGLVSWRWIFIVEGAFTAGLAFVLFLIVADFPEDARFLKANEKTFLKKKLAIYSGAESGYEITNKVSDVVKCFKDYLIWLPALAYFGFIIPSYGYAYFSATIIKEMGYTAVSANQHSVYPWLAAFGFSVIIAFTSDHLRIRLPFVILCLVVAITGLAMVLGATDYPKVRYGGCFLIASGLYSGMPVLVCWNSVNFGGHLRKSVGTAWQIGFGNIGGIIATFIFLTKDAPVYRSGMAVCISSACFAIICSTAYFFAVRRLNSIKQTDTYVEKFNALSERDQILAGDKNPNFRYLY